jgi:putative SOS response-associated peptidase YedK
MTTEPNGVVEPIHEKAMPVMLMTTADVEQWLRSVEDALAMQKPAPDSGPRGRPEVFASACPVLPFARI